MQPHLPLPLDPNALLAQVERHSREIAAILSDNRDSPDGEELTLLRSVETNVRALMCSFREGQLRGLEYLSGFAHNTLLCIGAHQTRYFEDLAALALTNYRLCQLATGEVVLDA